MYHENKYKLIYCNYYNKIENLFINIAVKRY